MSQDNDKDLELSDLESLEIGGSDAASEDKTNAGSELDLNLDSSMELTNQDSVGKADSTLMSDGLSLDGLNDINPSDESTRLTLRSQIEEIKTDNPKPSKDKSVVKKKEDLGLNIDFAAAEDSNLLFGQGEHDYKTSTRVVPSALKSKEDELAFEVPDNVDISFDESPSEMEEDATQIMTHRTSSITSEDIAQSHEYSHELERLGATIHNLRQDREELQKNLQKYEDDKIIHSRQSLNLRSELDEKKVEISILRKRMSTEHEDLKTKLLILEEKKSLLEERQKHLLQEIEKLKHREKIDQKHTTQRERDLEQKLELLKADSETQLRNRDVKIMELKRKIDAMDYDMETMTQQERRSLDSKVELEDKLEKAIKTLRGAISILESDEGKSSLLDKLKKNLDV